MDCAAQSVFPELLLGLGLIFSSCRGVVRSEFVVLCVCDLFAFLFSGGGVGGGGGMIFDPLRQRGTPGFGPRGPFPPGYVSIYYYTYIMYTK